MSSGPENISHNPLGAREARLKDLKTKLLDYQLHLILLDSCCGPKKKKNKINRIEEQVEIKRRIDEVRKQIKEK